MRLLFNKDHGKEFEKELLHKVRAGSKAQKQSTLDDGYKSCANINCPSYGSPILVENFFKNKTRPDGLDNYCKYCRNTINWRAWDKDPTRAERWADARKENRRIKRLQCKGTLSYEHKQLLCRKHPWMLKNDCMEGACGLRKRDKRYGPRMKAVREKMRISALGRCNNPTGINIRKGHKRIKYVYTYTDKVRMSEGMRRHWDAIKEAKADVSAKIRPEKLKIARQKSKKE